MKLLYTLLCLTLIFGCGSSKSIPKDAPSTTETVTDPSPQEPQGGEFTPPKEDDSQVEVPTEEPVTNWSKEDKLAYWINAYNAMTIDLIIRHYPTNSIKEIDKPWQQRYWKLGDKWYNLDEIEHQIIRKMGEPRIHFALVCAAKSCPKLYNKAFTAKTLDSDLSKLTKEFLTDNSKNNISQNTIKLSKIFKWFAKDFKQDGSLIDFLNQYVDITISSKAKKSFKDYNWDLND